MDGLWEKASSLLTFLARINAVGFLSLCTKTPQRHINIYNECYQRLKCSA